MPDGKMTFDDLPLQMAPSELKGASGRYMPVSFQGRILPMRAEAVAERLRAGERLQIATWDEYDEARARKVSGEHGGALGAGAMAVANGALLNMGVPLTQAALQAINPSAAQGFHETAAAYHKANPGITLTGEIAGAFLPLPGNIIHGVVDAGRLAAEMVGGLKAARAVKLTAEAKAALGALGEGKPAAAAAGEAAGTRALARTGTDAELLGTSRAAPRLAAAGEAAAPELGLPTRGLPPRGAAAAATEAELGELAAPAARARALEAPAAEARMLEAGEGAAPKALRAAETEAAAALPEGRAARQLGPAAAEELPPTSGELWAPYMRRGAAAAEVAATEAPELTSLREAAASRLPAGGRIFPATEEQLAAAREVFPSAARGTAEGGPLAVPRGARVAGGALAEVRRATEALVQTPFGTATPAALEAAEQRILEGVEAAKAPTAAAAVPEEAALARVPPAELAAPEAAAPETALQAPPGAPPPPVEGAPAAPPVPGGVAPAEGAAAPLEGAAPELGAGAADTGLVPPDVYGAAYGEAPMELSEAGGPEHFAGRIREIKAQTLATEGQRLLAAQNKADLALREAHAESVREIAKAMGRVPSAFDPEFLVRAFAEGAGSRLTYNSVNDKANTIPGIVGDGVMAAVAAAGMHAGLSKLLSKFGSKAGATISKEEIEFQKAALSNDPAEKVNYLQKQMQNAAIRRVGLDKARFLENMEKYMPENDDFAGGFEYVAQTLLHDLPRAHGKSSLGGFKSYDELYKAINSTWTDANKVIDDMLTKLDAKAVGTPGKAPTFSASKVRDVFNTLTDLESEALQTRVAKAGGPATAQAVREATVEFLRMQGALDEGLMRTMGTTRQALSNPELTSLADLENMLIDGWESKNISYAGLKHTALEMRKLSYRGELDPLLRGSKEVFAKVRGTLEKTLEADMDRAFSSGGTKYKYAKRQWQAWNYINEAMEEKLWQNRAKEVGGENSMSVLARMGVTGYTAMFHPITAGVMGAGFIAPRAAALHSVQNAWMGLLQKLSGGIHIDNKRLAMAAAIEKGSDDFHSLDLSKIPAGKTRVIPASEVLETLYATRALAQDPRHAMDAIQRAAQSAGSISPELAADSVTRTQKAIALLGAALPRAMKSEQWGEPDAKEMRVDPFELKRWQNVFEGVVDPASIFDDLKMGNVSPDKVNVQEELYPEMMDNVRMALMLKQGKKTRSGGHAPKVNMSVGNIKMPKLHFEKAAAIKPIMMKHASVGMDKEHFQGAQDSYKALEGGPQQQGGGGGGASAPPSRMAAYQSPFGQATGMATGTQIASRRA